MQRSQKEAEQEILHELLFTEIIKSATIRHFSEVCPVVFNHGSPWKTDFSINSTWRMLNYRFWCDGITVNMRILVLRFFNNLSIKHRVFREPFC